jgi:hypothetical protein
MFKQAISDFDFFARIDRIDPAFERTGSAVSVNFAATA